MFFFFFFSFKKISLGSLDIIGVCVQFIFNEFFSFFHQQNLRGLQGKNKPNPSWLFSECPLFFPTAYVHFEPAKIFQGSHSCLQLMQGDAEEQSDPAR